jgi:hypothetical protein
MNLNINISYLDIIDIGSKKYKTKIETTIDDEINKNSNYIFDYFYKKYYIEYIRKIKIKDPFYNNGYKYLRLITYRKKEIEKINKKHDMKLWKYFNIKNEMPKSNNDGTIDWKIKWPLENNGNYVFVNGKILYFIERYNRIKDDYDINCYYIDINEKKVKSIIINRNLLKKTLEDHYDKESVNEYFTYFN